MQSFQSCFEDYGADYQATMERFLGNSAMYLKILEMLFLDDNLEKLADSIEKNNLTDAFAAAHTLKGVAGNLGLTPLYHAVCAIVEPLRAGEPREDYPAMCETIRSEFQRAASFHAALKRCIQK